VIGERKRKAQGQHQATGDRLLHINFCQGALFIALLAFFDEHISCCVCLAACKHIDVWGGHLAYNSVIVLAFLLGVDTPV